MLGSNVVRVQGQQSLRLALTLRNIDTRAPINLTGAELSVATTTLPFLPIFEIVDPLKGTARMRASQSQMAGLALEKQYSIKVKLVDAGGDDHVFPAMILEVQG